MENSFCVKDFKKEFGYGDLSGLEYLEKTIIKDFKDKYDKYDKYNIEFSIEEYLLDLFYATKYLNYCNNIYEIGEVAPKFNYDLYFQTKDLLFTELEKYLGLSFGSLEVD